MSPNTGVAWLTPTAKAQNSPQGQRVGGRGTGWAQGLEAGRGRRVFSRGRGMTFPCCCSNLSPRAAQVLKRLEPYQAQRDIFKRVAEINRRKLEQQRQLPW